MFGVAGPEDARLSRAFLEESEELVQKLGQSLVTLEDSSDSALVNEVFRLTHSLKSESALMGYASLSRLSHAMEDVLGMVRSGTLSLSKDVRDLLLAGADRSAAMISEIARDGKESESGAADIIRDLSTLVAPDRGSLSAEPGGPAEAGGEPVFDALELRRIREARDRGESLVRLSVTVVHDEPMKFARAFLVFSNLEQVVNVIRVAPTMDGEPVDDSRYEKTIFYITAPPGDDVIQSAARVDQISSVLVERIGFPDKAALKDSATGLERGDAAFTARPRTAEKTSIRVDTRKLDELWSFVAELVLQKAHIARLSDAVGKGMDAALIREELVESSDSLEKLSNGMQEAMRDARMIPISILFGKLPRLVRDLSRKLEKPAELVLAGEDTEIDRSLIEALSDPLTHIIRNCLDHGLEFPEERVRLGKPEKGRVTASARRQGGTIIIELADDGRGLDTERIRRKAIGMGVPGAATMEEARLQELVFLPGFSTKEVVTDLSGRGVGLDVVASRIRDELHGDVELMSEPGKGTRVILRLPLTLTIVNSLLVADQGQLYAIPLVDLDSTAKLAMAEISVTETGETAPWMGDLIPVYSVAGLLGGKRSTQGECFALVLRHGTNQGFLVVDELIEEREIVIKPVDDLINPLRLFSGVSVLDDGRLVFVLDTSFIRRDNFSG